MGKIEELHSIRSLHERKIQFKSVGPGHVRIGDIDFWPSTGTFIHRRTHLRGKGLPALFAFLEDGKLPMQVKKQTDWKTFFGTKGQKVCSFAPRGQHLGKRSRGY